MSMDLTEKVALVTGGSRGIGAATALKLAEAGAHIAITSRSDSEEARETCRKVEERGRTALHITGDTAKKAECVQAVSETVEEFGRLDVLIHNAGGNVPGSLEDEDIEERWYYAFDVHVHAALHLARAGVPYIRKNGEGAIVLVASIAGLRGLVGMLPYTTVKGALFEMGRSLAADLAPDNIRVNCISPGIIRTKFHENMTAEQQKFNNEYRVPLGREGSAEDIGEAIRELVQNEYLTGENLTVDGGLTMRMR
jgi:NAD(P)-dependent dehydrogenase (short-subunit alcohol dehydrogenase family)